MATALDERFGVFSMAGTVLMAGPVIMYPGSSNAGFGPGETLHFFPENGPSTCYLGQFPIKFKRPGIIDFDGRTAERINGVSVGKLKKSTAYLRPLLCERAPLGNRRVIGQEPKLRGDVTIILAKLGCVRNEPQPGVSIQPLIRRPRYILNNTVR
jgi:hypothetical protein